MAEVAVEPLLLLGPAVGVRPVFDQALRLVWSRKITGTPYAERSIIVLTFMKVSSEP